MDSLTTVQPTTVQPTTVEDTTSNVTVEPSYEEPVVISTLPELGGPGTGKYQDVPLCAEEPCEVIVSTINLPKLTTLGTSQSSQLREVVSLHAQHLNSPMMYSLTE